MRKKTPPDKQRQKLDRLQATYELLKQQLVEVGIALPGSVVTRSYRCGKPNCQCHHKSGKLHGPYHQWTRKVRGKTVGIRLDSSLVPLVKEWIRNARKMRKLITSLHRTAQEMVEIQAEIKRRG